MLLAAGCLPLLAYLAGSATKPLLALLVFSLSTTMQYNPTASYTNNYANPGVPITLTSVALAALCALLVLNVALRRDRIRVFPAVFAPFDSRLCFARYRIGHRK